MSANGQALTNPRSSSEILLAFFCFFVLAVEIVSGRKQNNNRSNNNNNNNGGKKSFHQPQAWTLFSFLLQKAKCYRPLSCSLLKALMLLQQQCWHPTVTDGRKVVVFFPSLRTHLHYANEQLIGIFSPPMNILHCNLPST